MRFAALILVADPSDDPDDSSNERFEERSYSRPRAYKSGGNDRSAGGDTDRELGRGMSPGVDGATANITGTAVDEDADGRSARELRRGRESGFAAETGTEGSFGPEEEPARARACALLRDFEDGVGAGGRSCGDTFAGSTDTFGKPE